MPNSEKYYIHPVMFATGGACCSNRKATAKMPKGWKSWWLWRWKNGKLEPSSRETRFKRVAVGFTPKEARMMVLSAFKALNILIGASPVLFVTFQRLISSRGTFWPV